MTRLRWPRLGLRREMLILLPVTVLLLMLLAGFTLFAYRSAVDLLTEERQRDMAQFTQRLAQDLGQGSWPSAAALRRRVPTASRVSIIDADGETLRSFGPPTTSPFAPLGGQRPQGVLAIGPDQRTDGAVVCFAPFRHRGDSYIVRVDTPAPELTRQRQTVHTLTWFVLPASLALLVLTLAFLPHFLRPYDTLVETVQSVAPEAGDHEDIAGLVATIEKALTGLVSATEPSPEEDILALQRALGAGLESGVLLLDTRARVLSLNAAGAEMLALEPIVDPTPVDASLAAHPELLQMLLEGMQGATGPPRQEIQLRTPSGPRTLGFTVHRLRRDDGDVRGHLVLFADLTESRREAEARQLETSLEQLGELAAGVAHELRNSLATLRGYLTLIDRHPDGDSITDYLEEIRRESEHLERVVQDFLAFAQPQSARVESVDLGALALAAAQDPALDGMPVEVHLEPDAAWKLAGDPQLLERALRNLLYNAAAAERDNGGEGPLGLSLRQSPDGLELWIEDRGPGVPEAVRERLFQPFVTGRAEGVGLGLSLSHRIVTLHGGRIAIEDREGSGTRVRLIFPSGAAAGS